jgi:hypothetical protein
MLKNVIIYSILLLLFVHCKKKQTAQNNYASNTQHISVLTQHNNNYRTGWNSLETKLTTSNVNASQFGKLFTLKVDDQVYAQPLVVGNLNMDNQIHNIVYVATVNNSIYAFDGDNGNLFWQKNYTAGGMRAPRNTDMTGACGGGYQDFSGNIGIVGTPVIDSAAQIIYFVARSTNGSSFVQYLHAVNIISGNEIAGSPVIITATYPGTGDGSVNNTLSFDAQRQNQRQALILLKGMVFITWSSHCDWGPYHGWIMGYNAKTLQQQIVYNDTPDGSDGGIWESGGGLAADDAGNLYAAVGNGTVGVNNDPTNLRNRGESALKLSVTGNTLTVSSFFTPFNYADLDNNDLDFGSIGSLLIPGSNYFFSGSKDGNLFLLNKDNMGGYHTNANQVQQTISLNNVNANEHCQACYYKGAVNEFVYVWSENDNLKAFPFNRSTNMFDVNNTVLSPISGPSGQSGAVLSVSSNGNVAGTGILWASFANAGDAEHTVSPGILRALDASDVTRELWNSDMNIQSDYVGSYAKFSSPTIANGHIFLASFSNTVSVYGLK